MSAQENLRQIFQAPFNYNEYCHHIVHSIFGCNDIQTQPTPIETTSDNDQCYYIGRMEDADRRLIGFFYTRVADGADVRRRRVGLRKLISPYLKYEVDAAIAVFDDGQHWRLSYICDLKNESTTPRRFSYVMGDAHGQYRTPIEQLLKLQGKQLTLSDLHNAFSVEALSKEFYTDLFNWFQWATTPEKSGVYFPNDTNTTDDDFENLELKVIRLITRLMFIWFIKQKQLVPEKLFDATEMAKVLKDFDPQSDTQGCYYNAILQNLFFATLNRAIVDDDGTPRAFATLKNSRDVKSLYRYAEMFAIGEQQVIDMFSTVPFLNGGLFECLDKTKKIDGVDKAYNYDGFSRNDARFANGRYKHRAMVPNRLFFDPNIGLFSVLNRYNFTIEENSPNDLLVALDPEMLGKVFENLLGYYNPETRDTARNQSGSFYTPRPIVNYMVDESLKAYLGNTPLVNEIFKDDFQPDDLHWPDYQGIAAKLKSVKVFDPACGSGAFPMGLLNRIVELLQRLDPENNSTNGSYKFKLHLIEHCLYGCDIQSIAAQITKLRFFISLVCDCERDNSKPNFGIPTLPNLETKFVTANSLIGLTRQPGNILFLDTESKKTELRRVRHQHFNARTASEKIKLRNLDAQLRNELRELLVNNSVLAAADAQQMVEWNPYDQNAVSPFFDPEWMFGLTDGFDIVIGNPPYVQLQNNGGELAKKYENCNYSTFARTGDIYCLFYERGWQLLKKNGHLCYITSNKWMRAGYGEKTREFFAKNTNPMLLIDFAGVKIFESATVDTNILLFSKSSNQHQTVCAVTNKQNKDSVKNLSDFVQQQNSICDFATSDSWVILSPIEQSIKKKIEAVGTPLKDWDINIYRGVLTGCNEAFIIDSEKREEILANCQTEEERQRTEELIRPILRGRDIKRYGYEWAEQWLIATFPSRHYDIDKYPAVKQYLLSFGIERLEQTGKTHVVDGEKVKARKKTNNKWFETQDSISYWEDFLKPKIIWKIIGSRLAFAIDNTGIMLNNACYLLTGNHLTHVLGFLNSSPLIWYSEITNMNKTGVGDAQVGAQNIILFPVPSAIDAEVVDLVEQLINNPSQSKLKRTLSERIYAIYGLSNEERCYLESLNL